MNLPANLCELFLPQAMQPEAFVPGRPIKGRNEPSAVGGVAWVVHKVKEVPFEEIVEQGWRNTIEVFGLSELARDLSREWAFYRTIAYTAGLVAGPARRD